MKIKNQCLLTTELTDGVVLIIRTFTPFIGVYLGLAMANQHWEQLPTFVDSVIQHEPIAVTLGTSMVLWIITRLAFDSDHPWRRGARYTRHDLIRGVVPTVSVTGLVALTIILASWGTNAVMKGDIGISAPKYLWLL